MIIPYGHRGMKLHGVPWVTVGLFVLCVLVFLITNGASARASNESNEIFAEIVEVFRSNPSLKIDPVLLERIFLINGVDENQRDVFLRTLEEQAAAIRTFGEVTVATQHDLDRLTDRYWKVYRSAPSYRFGVVPSSVNGFDLVSYQFLHAGWFHLLGNLLFLYLVAPHIEQRWGRPLFLVFYLLSGVVAALFWAVRYPDLNTPLVGASGSIAGLMGAFLVCFGASKIRFFYWFFIVWGTFEAPAWLMLPMWLVMEVVSGRSADIMTQGVGGGGVAHWAHVWGFIFGMVFAGGSSLLGLDRELAEASEPPTPPGPPPRHRRPIGQERVLKAPAGDAVETQEPLPEPAAPVPLPLAEPIAAVEEDGLPEVIDLVEEDGLPEVIEISETARLAVELRPAERLKVLEGVPQMIEKTVLIFSTGDDRRRIDLSKIEAIAVGAVAQAGGKPFFVVDLLFDPPWDGTGDLRILRLRSSSFDPRRLVGGDRPMDAFGNLLARLLELSGATPLPDADSIFTPGSRTYASLDEYQGEVLGVMG